MKREHCKRALKIQVALDVAYALKQNDLTPSQLGNVEDLISKLEDVKFTFGNDNDDNDTKGTFGKDALMILVKVFEIAMKFFDNEA